MPTVTVTARQLRVAGAALAAAALLFFGRMAIDALPASDASPDEPPVVAEAPEEVPDQNAAEPEDPVEQGAAEPQLTGDAIGWVPAPTGEAAGRRADRSPAPTPAEEQTPAPELTYVPLAPATTKPALPKPARVKVDVRAVDERVRAGAKAAKAP